LDELSTIVFATAKLIRAAKLFYEDRREEIVFVPMIYGVTWEIGNEYDRDGRITRFVDHLDIPEVVDLGVGGIGVGQQDFTVRTQNGGGSLFGIGSVNQIIIPLDISDPKFDEKARKRGIDPEEVRRSMSKSEHYLSEK
jgi:hypothetical protein